MPEETIFMIPLRLEDCTPPRSLRDWQYADYFEGQRDGALKRLLISLKRRADSLGLKSEEVKPKEERLAKNNKVSTSETKSTVVNITKTQKPAVLDSKLEQKISSTLNWSDKDKVFISNSMEFMRVSAGKFIMGSDDHSSEKPQHEVDIPYDYWMARFPITNNLYYAYTKVKGIKHPVDDWEKKENHPVVSIKWNAAMEYCQWLNNSYKDELPSGLILRLPTEAEWEKAARGIGANVWPWGNKLDILSKCNFKENGTTPVGDYSPMGDSPYGCADMAGNVWEWTHSLMKPYPYKSNDGREDENTSGRRVLRGGSYGMSIGTVRCAKRILPTPFIGFRNVGFRVIATPDIS